MRIFAKVAFKFINYKCIVHSGWKPRNANLDNANHKKFVRDLILCHFCCDSAFSVPEIVRHQALPYFVCEADNCEFYSKKLPDTEEDMKNQHGINEYKPYQCRHCDSTQAFSKFAKHMLVYAYEKSTTNVISVTRNFTICQC